MLAFTSQLSSSDACRKTQRPRPEVSLLGFEVEAVRRALDEDQLAVHPDLLRCLMEPGGLIQWRGPSAVPCRISIGGSSTDNCLMARRNPIARGLRLWAWRTSASSRIRMGRIYLPFPGGGEVGIHGHGGLDAARVTGILVRVDSDFRPAHGQ